MDRRRTGRVCTTWASRVNMAASRHRRRYSPRSTVAMPPSIVSPFGVVPYGIDVRVPRRLLGQTGRSSSSAAVPTVSCLLTVRCATPTFSPRRR